MSIFSWVTGIFSSMWDGTMYYTEQAANAVTGLVPWDTDNKRHGLLTQKNTEAESLAQFLTQDNLSDVEKQHIKIALFYAAGNKLSDLLDSPPETELDFNAIKRISYLSVHPDKQLSQDKPMADKITKRLTEAQSDFKQQPPSFPLVLSKQVKALIVKAQEKGALVAYKSGANLRTWTHKEKQNMALSVIRGDGLNDFDIKQTLKTLLYHGLDLNEPLFDGSFLINHLFRAGLSHDLISFVLWRGAEPNRCEPNGDNSLHVAIRARAGLDNLALLQGYMTDLNVVNQEGLTPLNIAMLEKNDEGANFLLTMGARSDLLPRQADNPLCILANHPSDFSLSTIDALMSSKPDVVGAESFLGYSLFGLAVQKGWSLEAKKALVSTGSAIDGLIDGAPLLITLVKQKEPAALLSLLLDKGADPNVIDPQLKRTYLEWLLLDCTKTDSYVPSFLGGKTYTENLVIQSLEKGSCPTLFSNGESLLETLIKMNLDTSACIAIEKGADVNVSRDGHEPLIFQVLKPFKPSVLDAMLNKRVNIDIQRSDGKTPLMVAVEHFAGQDDKTLFFKLARLSDKNTIQGASTVLNRAIALNWSAAEIDTLLKLGFPVNGLDEKRRTPAMLAFEHQYPQSLVMALIGNTADQKDQDDLSLLDRAFRRLVKPLTGPNLARRALSWIVTPETPIVYDHQLLFAAFGHEAVKAIKPYAGTTLAKWLLEKDQALLFKAIEQGVPTAYDEEDDTIFHLLDAGLWQTAIQHTKTVNGRYQGIPLFEYGLSKGLGEPFIKTLMTLGLSLDTKTSQGVSLITHAIEKNFSDKTIVSLFKPSDTESLIRLMKKEGKEELIKTLVNHGAALDEDILHLALSNDKPKAFIQFLLQRGASRSHPNLAFLGIEKKVDDELMRALVSPGSARLKPSTWLQAESLLVSMIEAGYSADTISTSLLGLDKLSDLKPQSGEPLLHLVMRKKLPLSLVKTLIGKGVDDQVCNSKSQSLLDSSLESQDIEAVNYFINNGVPLKHPQSFALLLTLGLSQESLLKAIENSQAMIESHINPHPVFLAMDQGYGLSVVNALLRKTNNETLGRLKRNGLSAYQEVVAKYCPHLEKSCDIDSLALLKNKGANFDEPLSEKENILFQAVRQSVSEDYLSGLMGLHPFDVNAIAHDDHSLLFHVKNTGYGEKITQQLNGAELTTQETLTLYAKWSMPYALGSLLLGASVWCATKINGGWTGLHYLSRSGAIENLIKKIGNGDNLNQMTDHGETALNIAIRYNNQAAIKTLLEAGASLNPDYQHQQKPYLGWYPLHFSVFHQDIAMIKRMIDSGANLLVQNAAHETPLQLANRLKSPPELIDLLKTKQAALLPAFSAYRAKPLPKSAQHFPEETKALIAALGV